MIKVVSTKTDYFEKLVNEYIKEGYKPYLMNEEILIMDNGGELNPNIFNSTEKRMIIDLLSDYEDLFNQGIITHTKIDNPSTVLKTIIDKLKNE